MTFRTLDPRFEAHSATAVESATDFDALTQYLNDRYAIEPIRPEALVAFLGDILHGQNTEATEFMLRHARSERFKLVTLFSRLANQPGKDDDVAPAPPEDPVWDRIVPNQRWHTHIRTDYAHDADGKLFNRNASVSNFPKGDSDIKQKIQGDHRINYFLWSLWEGMSAADKAACPHLAYERQPDRSMGTALGSRFVRLLLLAEHRLSSAIAAVEACDARHVAGTDLPHVHAREHADIVDYHVDQALFQAGHGHANREPLRAELIKHAALNMACNELDGTEELDEAARRHTPLHLPAVLALDAAAPWHDGADELVLAALAADFGIARKAIHADTIAMARRLAAIYVAERRPAVDGVAERFDAPHLSVRSHALHAALLVHDWLHKPAVPRQVAGDTRGVVSAFQGIRKYLMNGAAQPLTESHHKFYLNRYAALHYGITPGYSLEESVASYYAVRQAKRMVLHRFYDGCRKLDSARIAAVVPGLAPERLLHASQRAMPGTRIPYRLR